MHTGFCVEAPARRPAFMRVTVAYTGRGYIAYRRIGKRAQHLEKITFGRNMIGIELRDEIIALVPVMVIKKARLPSLQRVRRGQVWR